MASDQGAQKDADGKGGAQRENIQAEKTGITEVTE